MLKLPSYLFCLTFPSWNQVLSFIYGILNLSYVQHACLKTYFCFNQFEICFALFFHFACIFLFAIYDGFCYLFHLWQCEIPYLILGGLVHLPWYKLQTRSWMVETLLFIPFYPFTNFVHLFTEIMHYKIFLYIIILTLTNYHLDVHLSNRFSTSSAYSCQITYK